MSKRVLRAFADELTEGALELFLNVLRTPLGHKEAEESDDEDEDDEEDEDEDDDEDDDDDDEDDDDEDEEEDEEDEEDDGGVINVGSFDVLKKAIGNGVASGDGDGDGDGEEDEQEMSDEEMPDDPAAMRALDRQLIAMMRARQEAQGAKKARREQRRLI